jgi:aspartyl-tRNA(Asn)/glutamyl-tRNA(Gln) amidotransferase subunit A
MQVLDPICGMSAGEIAEHVNARRLGPREVVQAHLDAIDGARELKAVITVCADEALSRCDAGPSGPLAGVPLLVKDIFDTAGIRTTYGSAIYAEHVPRRTAAAIRQLEDAGAVIIGKANLHEFAWGTTSQNPHWGVVQNPTHPGRVAGGSSGGNASALAASLCALGVGSDTGGSVRLPAACCSIVGFKPSLGKVSTRGCFSLSPSFDTVGPMARSVRDCALAHAVLTGESVIEPALEGLVVGVLDQSSSGSPHEPGTTGGPKHSVAVEEYAARLEALGARIVETTLPEPEADVVPLFLAEAAITHRKLFPAQRDLYGSDVQLKLEAARKVPALDLYEAKRALPRWRARARVEPAVDLIVTPTLSIDVPSIDVWEPDVRVQMVSYTRTFNFLGWPAIALGELQLAGRSDEVVLGAALAYDEAYPLASAR